jgi:hypothetical protein
MTNLSAWAGGALNTGSIAYQAAFATGDLNITGGIPNGSSVMSTIVFDNTAGLDEFMDISFVGAYIAAETVTPGACISFYLALLQNDNVTYGDGRLTAGVPAAYTPNLNPLPAITIQVGTTITVIAGDTGLITLRPRKSRLILQNNSLFNLAATGNSCSISTYRQNLNAS